MENREWARSGHSPDRYSLPYHDGRVVSAIISSMFAIAGALRCWDQGWMLSWLWQYLFHQQNLMALPRVKNCQPVIRLASGPRGSAVKPTIIVRWEARAVREESLTCNSVAVLRVPTCMYHVRLWTPYSQWRKRIAVKNIMYVHVEGWAEKRRIWEITAKTDNLWPSNRQAPTHINAFYLIGASDPWWNLPSDACIWQSSTSYQCSLACAYLHSLRMEYIIPPRIWWKIVST